MAVFTESELAQIPEKLHPLTNKFPVAFDNLFEMLNSPPVIGEIETKEVYYDDDEEPAISFNADDEVISASETTETPTIISIHLNGLCCFVQAADESFGSQKEF